jgi:hypothetical protein
VVSQAAHPGASTPTDEQVLEKCRTKGDTQKFNDLYDHGDSHTYHGGDDSAADLGLIGMMRFWTQDPAQLERLFSASALGQRGKWQNRADYRARTINEALEGNYETYNWTTGRSRSLVSSSSVSLGVSGDDDTSQGPKTDEIEQVKVWWFHKLDEPKEREFLIESIGVKGYPIVAFGAGGVAKSLAMLSAGISIASTDSRAKKWLGLQILQHGHVLYLDFELDVDEQHRRVRDLCAGMGIEVPKRFAYISGVGVIPEAAFAKAHAHIEEHKVLAVVIDSMGLAMQGDMEKGRDVLGFHSRNINPMRRAGATPFIVDHEGKRQTGEKHKDKAPIGSAYKAWASRSVLQFEQDEYDKEAKTLYIRVRQTKTNFGPKVEPIGLKVTFEEKKVTMHEYELPDLELIEEETKPVKERILGALQIGPSTNAELQKLTGATAGTIRNKLSELVQEGKVREEGANGRQKIYGLVLSSSPHTPRGVDDDDTSQTPKSKDKPETVANLAAKPPQWFSTGLRQSREDYDRYFRAFCHSVVSTLPDGADRRPEIEGELRALVNQLTIDDGEGEDLEF